MKTRIIVTKYIGNSCAHCGADPCNPSDCLFRDQTIAVVKHVPILKPLKNKKRRSAR